MALQVGVVIIKNRFCQFLAGIFWIIDLPLHELFVETSHFPGDGNYFFAIDQTRAVSPASSRGPKWIKVSEIPAHERVHLAGAHRYRDQTTGLDKRSVYRPFCRQPSGLEN